MQATIGLEFEGYWADRNSGGLPAASGIYCVYDGELQSTGQVRLRKLIYIGESADIRDRIAGHEKRSEWKRHLGPGGELYFSCAKAGMAERQRGEAAMIFQHKPPVNVEYRNEFPFDDTTMILNGETALLKTAFTVRRTSVRPRP